jgi:hypothetical protein
MTTPMAMALGSRTIWRASLRTSDQMRRDFAAMVFDETSIGRVAFGFSDLGELVCVQLLQHSYLRNRRESEHIKRIDRGVMEIIRPSLRQRDGAPLHSTVRSMQTSKAALK